MTDLEFDGNDFIDAGDLLADPVWEDGIDDDGNGLTDDLIGWDFRDNDNDPLDTHGHGTHVSGTIGAACHSSITVKSPALRSVQTAGHSSPMPKRLSSCPSSRT